MGEDRDALRAARSAYAEGGNVMRLFRERDPEGRNSADAVLISYDLQSGTYRRLLDDPEHRARVERYTAAIARVLDELEFDSMLEAGTGEATTLVAVLDRLARVPGRVAAFDLAWSRVAHGRAHAREAGVSAPELFTGDLFAMPVADDAFDLVWTAHALEPNGGRELEGLAELARVTRRWLVLFEPGYELGGPGTRERVEEHGYVRGLPAAAEQVGLTIVRHELLSDPISPVNETAVLVLRKDDGAAAPAEWRACPRCRQALLALKGELFCPAEGLVYPIVDGIPCLDARNAVVASAFADDL
ncbi:methyltransferase domain-containing protein [Solirubrobacter soli]|uniref:methyltransferase domain-containing protein n=1 Tax=Solirubrobacter soli TaxID=363832 RepID=UPI0003FB072D|nr:methyltransferase domain-containing protein [Solirubrobacter soli]